MKKVRKEWRFLRCAEWTKTSNTSGGCRRESSSKFPEYSRNSRKSSPRSTPSLVLYSALFRSWRAIIFLQKLYFYKIKTLTFDFFLAQTWFFEARVSKCYHDFRFKGSFRTDLLLQEWNLSNSLMARETFPSELSPRPARLPIFRPLLLIWR